MLRHIENLDAGGALIRLYRYGAIQCENCCFRNITFRPFPKLVSGFEAAWWAARRVHSKPRDRCRLYYSAPVSHEGFLTLNYICSDNRTSYATFRMALRVLDHIAVERRSLAIVCETFNTKLSDRMMIRWGWERHCMNSKRRHWIRRFYGDYSKVEKLLNSDQATAGTFLNRSRPVNIPSTELDTTPAPRK